jgi:hypothetical protein
MALDAAALAVVILGCPSVLPHMEPEASRIMSRFADSAAWVEEEMVGKSRKKARKESRMRVFFIISPVGGRRAMKGVDTQMGLDGKRISHRREIARMSSYSWEIRGTHFFSPRGEKRAATQQYNEYSCVAAQRIRQSERLIEK